LDAFPEHKSHHLAKPRLLTDALKREWLLTFHRTSLLSKI